MVRIKKTATVGMVKTKVPSKKVSDAIVRRYLKPDQNIDWRREMPQWYNLYRQYPSLDFWQNYELPFGNGTLNHMSWFISIEGAIELERAWILFHYVPSAPESVKLEPIDSVKLSGEIYVPPLLPPSKPRSIADFLSSS